ncbi:MAG: DTW domain-containing protein [Gammaproteobacteria bacterium]|nr:DTW domain-containing protein [Gammaproteobacteria bacterium]
MKRQQCLQCNRPQSVCICHCLKTVDNQWPVWILQHPAELKHAIGTAKIATLSLKNILTIDSEQAIINKNIKTEIISRVPTLVYPGADAMTLTQLQQLSQEEHGPLLFLDGSWRKTRKMLYDFPELEKLPRVAIQPDTHSRYRIRKEPNETAISTLEAIVYVLSQLENDKAKYQPLLDTMDWMINKQIEYMGKETYLKNYEKNNDNDK